MAKVLLAWELGGGAGHCAKLAAVAQGLIDKGHEISIAARDLVTARHILGPIPVAYFQAPYATRGGSSTAARSIVDILINTGFGDATSLEVLCAAWRSLFSAAKPDVLICDHAPMALLASRWHSMRRVVVGTGFTVPPLVSPLPDLRYWLPGTSQSIEDLRRTEEVVLRGVNEFLTRDHLPPLDRLADLYADVDQSFLLTFRELDHYPQREGAYYFGIWPQTGGRLLEWPANGPRIFAYLKPPTPDWKLEGLLAFLRESHLASVMYIAGANPGWLRKFQTPRLRFVARPVDIAHAAQHCDVAVLNGTAGSATALLLAGIPQLNIPLYLEQLILSRRVSDLGAGLYANPSRPEQMAARLMTLLQNNRYREAAKAFSQCYAAFNATKSKEKILSAIHELLTAKVDEPTGNSV